MSQFPKNHSPSLLSTRLSQRQKPNCHEIGPLQHHIQSSTSPTFFGLLSMLDDKLTTGPEPNSSVVGQAQGIYGSACLEEAGLLMTLNLIFSGADYNGSTLSLLGRNPLFHPYREMPIVGGSRVFRMARGIATAKPYGFNLTSSDATVEYNVIVVHY